MPHELDDATPDEAAPDDGGHARVIDISVEVVGTPDEVWRAIATGPGISSWFVPTTVDERDGGATTSRFGDGPEMLIPGRVTAWEPPHRVVFGAEGSEAGLAYEWLVEARDGGTCIVRLVNSGFGAGDDWDAQYDGMSQGWRLFMHNLQLHLAHFAGQVGMPMLPMAMWSGPRARTWSDLVAGLGIPAGAGPGDRVGVDERAGAPPLAGTVVEAESWRLSLLLDEPAPGTALLAAEGDGDLVGVSVWLYLYGPRAAYVVARDEPAWRAWLADRAPS